MLNLHSSLRVQAPFCGTQAYTATLSVMALTSRSTNDIQARVQDYLDDKIQTAADLDGINALVARVQEQQRLLQNQVSTPAIFFNSVDR